MVGFLKSKKGFTIVELMIVLVLLSFGAFAVINLSQAAWRSFNKSEERYIKQEEVKTVADNLQRSASVTAATKMDIYKDMDVVPKDGVIDDTYNYIFVDPSDGYLYIKPAKTANRTRITTVPMYIDFDMIPYETTNLKGEIVTDTNQGRGVVCQICALENGVSLMDDSGTLKKPISDEIYYSLSVSYHFPNMVENGALFVNRYQNSADSYEVAEVNGIPSTDTDGYILRFVSAITLRGEDLISNTNANMYCFVATAAYGVNNGDGTVGLLCDFRDSVLMQSAPGRAFVKAYYTVSPPIAKVIAGSEPLKAAVRIALKPLVIVATFALDHDLLAANTAYIVILMITTAAAVTVIAYCRRKRRKE